MYYFKINPLGGFQTTLLTKRTGHACRFRRRILIKHIIIIRAGYVPTRVTFVTDENAGRQRERGPEARALIIIV